MAVALNRLLDLPDKDLKQPIPEKHKFAVRPISSGESIQMYGVDVGVALKDIEPGELITGINTGGISGNSRLMHSGKYQAPAVDTGDWQTRTFQGIRRPDGRTGTANYWIFVPLVFCENHNLKIIENTLQEALGYQQPNPYVEYAQGLLGNAHESKTVSPRKFDHIDGLRFLYHQGGCGGTRDDAESLMHLLAGYVHHPNVAGATVLSLGCQNAQLDQFRAIESKLYPDAKKPRVYLEHQQVGDEDTFIRRAISETIQELERLPVVKREPRPLSELVVGLECGGSDGFSGITANPLTGEVSDLIGALGGTSILAEFPELAGMEQEIVNRCKDETIAGRFLELFQSYAERARALGVQFEQNPSPGNIREGLITLGMKSAGAIRKGGYGIITDVLDYTEKVRTAGLNLLCTPGNDVESTTALAASGANVILFTTGLGTPTGNPIVPVIKLSSNSNISSTMHDIIDFDAGRLIAEPASYDLLKSELMELIIAVAGGKQTCAMNLGQYDFIPWKRGISL